jgi:hypothetical protein
MDREQVPVIADKYCIGSQGRRNQFVIFGIVRYHSRGLSRLDDRYLI